MTSMRRLLDLGQSVWLDYLSRRMTRSGELHTLIADGLRGMTSNPTIFEHEIAGTPDYDQDLTALAGSARTDRDIFETLVIEDVGEAADVFRAVFDSTAGGDGFVSLEVSPRLAHDTEGSVAEARRLWKALNRPKGAKPQRLLWASTGTKNPEYSDVLYVDSLIGPYTITTVPPATLRLFEDHGQVSRTLGEDDATEARQVMKALGDGGIDFADVKHTLEEAGIETFVNSLDSLLGVIANKRRALRADLD